MHITHVIKATQIGGAERHLLYLLPALQSRGATVRLVMMVEPNTPMEDMYRLATESGIETERLTIHSNRDVGILSRLKATFQAHPTDIVHTHLIHADVLGLLAAKWAGVRHSITTRHNDDSFRHHWLVSQVNRWNWRNVTRGIVISEALKPFVMTIEGAPAQKLHVVRYGMPFTRLNSPEQQAHRHALRERLALDPDTPIVGMACRLTEQKGIFYAIQAIKLLSNDFPHLHAVIAGDGELRPMLQHLAHGLGLDGRVHFLGWQNDIPSLMAGFDMFLMPSLWEGFGLVLLEAMAARLPIVASHVSAIPEVVLHGETGFLTAPRDPEAIAHALSILLNDRPLRLHMGQNGEARLEEAFSVQRMAEETLTVYQHTLGG